MSPSDSVNWREQILTHLRHLRGAGIDWLPAAPPLKIAPRETAERASEPTPAGSIFDIADESSPRDELTLDERRIALQTLAEEIKPCTRCADLCNSRTQTVFADGPAGAELCFVGEAPGADEDAQGIPFVGAAGQLLTRIINACGFQREEVYICNILKCRPPNNRTPLADEAHNCRGFLEKQLALVKPNYIVGKRRAIIQIGRAHV